MPAETGATEDNKTQLSKPYLTKRSTTHHNNTPQIENTTNKVSQPSEYSQTKISAVD